jgi:NhaA family Na+:H+ antiporter
MTEPASPSRGLPREPIARLTEPIERFMHVESASGVVLLVATVTALALANSGFSEAFLGFWKTPLGFEIGSFQMRHSLAHWINDGLMAIFFFVIGLEVKREIVHGELGDPRQAVLPIAAAVGGMVVPAVIYLTLQGDGPAASGWGIPMATDIAFVVGCLALFGPRVPRGLRVLLLTVAIVDDIGAILVIAVAYTDTIGWGALAAGLVGIGAIGVLSRLGVRGFGMYGLLGLGVWLAFHESGVHATIAGVILGLMTPARRKATASRRCAACAGRRGRPSRPSSIWRRPSTPGSGSRSCRSSPSPTPAFPSTPRTSPTPWRSPSPWVCSSASRSESSGRAGSRCARESRRCPGA